MDLRRVARSPVWLGLCALAAFAFAAASPSTAGASLSQCNGGAIGWFCLWQDAGFNGTFWAWNRGSPGTPTREWFYVGKGANDKASSLDNFRLYQTNVSENANWKTEGGGHACIKAGENMRNLNAGPGGGPWAWPQNFHSANDSISGIYLDAPPGGKNCANLPRFGYIVEAAADQHHHLNLNK